MRNVLYINFEYYPDFSGHAEYLRKIFPLMQEHGIQPYVLAEESAGAPKNHNVEGIDVIRIKKRDGSPFRALRQSIDMARHIFMHRNFYSLIHINGHVDRYGILVALCKVLNIPIIMHMVLLGSDDPISIRKAYKLMIFRMPLLRQFDAYIAISKKIFESCINENFQEKKIEHIPQGVDTSKFLPALAHEKDQLRRLFGLDHYEKIVIFVGSIMERKGIAELLKEWRILQKKNPSYGLILAGKYAFASGTEMYAYAQRQLSYAKEHSLNVSFLGQRNDIPDLLRASDLLVLPSLNEGFGNVIIEAFSSGLPVIATPMQGVSADTVEPNYNGFITEHDGIALRISNLLMDQELLDELSSNARKTALNKFNLVTIVERYTQLYDSLIK